MGRGHAIGVQVVQGPLEEGVPRAVTGLLNRDSLLLRPPAHIRATDLDTHRQLVGQLTTEPLIIVSRTAQLMIQMYDAGEDAFQGSGELVHQRRQSHGIGATGQRHEHTALRRNEALPIDQPEDAFLEGGHEGVWCWCRHRSLQSSRVFPHRPRLEDVWETGHTVPSIMQQGSARPQHPTAEALTRRPPDDPGRPE